MVPLDLGNVVGHFGAESQSDVIACSLRNHGPCVTEVVMEVKPFFGAEEQVQLLHLAYAIQLKCTDAVMQA